MSFRQRLLIIPHDTTIGTTHAESSSQNDFGVGLFFDQETSAKQLEILLLGCFACIQHKSTNTLAL